MIDGEADFGWVREGAVAGPTHPAIQPAGYSNPNAWEARVALDVKSRAAPNSDQGQTMPHHLSIYHEPVRPSPSRSPERRRGWLAALGALAIVAFSTTANAQSDSCQTATSIDPNTRPVAVAGTTVGATNDGSASCGQSNTSPDVWYTFTGHAGQTYTIDTCGTLFDTVVSVHGDCGIPGRPSATLACNDNATDGDCRDTLTSSVVFRPIIASQYRIRVSGNNGATGQFVLRVTRGAVSPTLPTNETCSYPVSIVNYDANYNFSLFGAWPSVGLPGNACANSIGPDVWYRVVPCVTGPMTVSTCGSTSIDTVLAVYQGACDSMTYVTCNDNGCGTQSTVNFNATAGVQYLIRVGLKAGAPFRGIGSIRVTGRTCPTRPSNDNFGGAAVLSPTTLPGQHTVTNGTTVGATSDGYLQDNTSSNTSPDVWYMYTSDSLQSERITIDTFGTGFPTMLSVHTAPPGMPGNCLRWNDNAYEGDCFASGTSSITFQTALRTTYWIRVAGINNASGPFILRSARRSPIYVPPNNDLCGTAQPVGYGSFPFTTVGAFVTDMPTNTPLMGDCPTYMRSDVWFYFTACSTGTVTASTCNNNMPFDTMVAVHTGSCASPTVIACNDSGCGIKGRVSFNAIAGVGYYIRVGARPGFDTLLGPGTLIISGPSCPVATVPDNNSCSAAENLGMFTSDDPVKTASGTTVRATRDGATSCGTSNTSPDVWYSFTTANDGFMILDTCGSSLDTVLSVHSACGGTAANTLMCSDNATQGPCANCGTASHLIVGVVANTRYYVRVAGNSRATGAFRLFATFASNVPAGTPGPCPCDWDGNGSLEAEDIVAFIDGFMNSTTDFNNDGYVDPEDLADFLDCYTSARGSCAN